MFHNQSCPLSQDKIHLKLSTPWFWLLAYSLCYCFIQWTHYPLDFIANLVKIFLAKQLLKIILLMPATCHNIQNEFLSSGFLSEIKNIWADGVWLTTLFKKCLHAKKKLSSWLKKKTANTGHKFFTDFAFLQWLLCIQSPQ